MSDIVDDLEKQKISLGSLLKWGSSLIGFIIFVTGLYYRLEAIEKAQTAIEARLDHAIESNEVRIRNLEEHVIWRHEP